MVYGIPNRFNGQLRPVRGAVAEAMKHNRGEPEPVSVASAVGDATDRASMLPLVATLVRPETLANRVQAELQRLIVESQLGVGDRLPTERDLAEQFGVSRTVVREAVRALVAKGLIEVAAGRGAMVRAPSPEWAAESIGLLMRHSSSGLDYDKVIEVRRMLEVQIAALAASRRTKADLDDLDAILDGAANHVADADAFISFDVAFHAALARATHNELFSALLDSLSPVMVEVRRLGLRVPGTPQRALDHHCSVLDAVRARQVRIARVAMNRHMDEARDTLQAALAKANPW